MYKIGEFVTYIPFNNCPISLWEKGKVKSISDKEHIFVVYHCNDDWNDYENYTAARTHIRNLL